MIVDRNTQNWTPLAGLGGLGGAAVANYFSGHADDPLAGYCDILKTFGDLGVSEYGPGGCQDFADCAAGKVPSAPTSLCEQSLRDASGTQWCFISGKWYPLGIGCSSLFSRATTDMSSIQTGGTPVGCAPGWELGVDNQCHPQGYAPTATPAPVTPQQVEASKVASSIFLNNAPLVAAGPITTTQTNVPPDIATAMGTGLSLLPSSSWLASHIPLLLLLGGGGALLLLSGGRGR